VRIGVELIQAARPGRERVGAPELAAISEELAAGPPEVVGYGRVVGRTAAGVRRIDIDVTLQAGVAPQRMAEIAEILRSTIGRRVPGSRIVLHLRKPHRPSRKALGGKGPSRQ
jgi:divalent metal cation (Fe/Co/Zn/Cd) transporter